MAFREIPYITTLDRDSLRTRVETPDRIETWSVKDNTLGVGFRYLVNAARHPWLAFLPGGIPGLRFSPK